MVPIFYGENYSASINMLMTKKTTTKALRREIRHLFDFKDEKFSICEASFSTELHDTPQMRVLLDSDIPLKISNKWPREDYTKRLVVVFDRKPQEQIVEKERESSESLDSRRIKKKKSKLIRSLRG